jgi:gentisate 1,2-dioxygenase
MEAGTFITEREAQRRVLALENPGQPGGNHITRTLFAGIQLILPGEIAPSHRHAASALRYIIEGEGAYTAVNGERTTMKPGDFVVTPSWTFHDHGNPTDHPVIWLDGLDTGLVNTFDCSFFEMYPEEEYPVTGNYGDALARFGANMAPVDYKPNHLASPSLIYPYERSREALDQLYRSGPVDQCHGIKLQYINPVTGGFAIPTIATFLQFLPSGFQGAPYRSTDGTIFCVVQGSGHSNVGRATFSWVEHDVFVVPSWCRVSHQADQESVLFSFSDRAAQKTLGLWREEAPTG